MTLITFLHFRLKNFRYVVGQKKPMDMWEGVAVRGTAIIIIIVVVVVMMMMMIIIITRCGGE
jgi:hypothetical protein